MLTREMNYIPQEFEWINIEIKSVFVETGNPYSRPYAIRIEELGIFYQKHNVATRSSVTDRDTNEDIHVWNKANYSQSNVYQMYDRQFTGQQMNVVITDSSLHSNDQGIANNDVVYPASNYAMNVSFKLTGVTNTISQIDTRLSGSSPFGIPSEIDVYFGHTREEAESNSVAGNPHQTIDLIPLKSNLTKTTISIVELNETSGLWEFVS